MTEPPIRVGLVEGAAAVRLRLEGRFSVDGGGPAGPGDCLVARDGDAVVLTGAGQARGAALRLRPAELETGRVTVHDVTIGKDFHWQRRQSQSFEGTLHCAAVERGLTVVNELPLERYLASVISSEMRASSPTELLRSHAIVSRSWLLAQLAGPEPAAPSPAPPTPPAAEVRRWYDRESHAAFDVCADDHCQRYQGTTRAFTPAVFEAVRTTRGLVLVHGGEVCDARYSKCCGGITEVFPTAWGDRDVPYLRAVYDGTGPLPGFDRLAAAPEDAERWIRSSPPAFCRRSEPEFLARVLPGFDQETRDFYRWEVACSQSELGEVLAARLGRDLGRVAALEPLARGPSGRIHRLRIRAEGGTLVIGKELEIRRALSRSHLLSSAFVARGEGEDGEKFPRGFRLSGAGWGHGVGLCQIGAASLADAGAGYERILGHYFAGTVLRRLYA